MLSPRAAMAVIVSCARCSVCSDRRRAFAVSNSVCSTDMVHLLIVIGAVAGASGGAGLAAGCFDLQAGNDREQIRLDRAGHLDDSVLASFLGLVDQRPCRFELALVFGQEFRCRNEDWAGRAGVGV